MAPERRNQLLLGAVAIVLLVVAYQSWPRTSSSAVPASNQGRQAARSRAGGADQALTAPDVQLEALSAVRARPEETQRNLFQFKAKAAPPPPAPARPAAVARPAPAGPPPAPPLPPMTWKFIGIIDRGGQKIAVLSDAGGQVDYGVEGAIIGGRFRVLKIGVESIELAHLDGRGRQTIRLTGS